MSGQRFTVIDQAEVETVESASVVRQEGLAEQNGGPVISEASLRTQAFFENMPVLRGDPDVQAVVIDTMLNLRADLKQHLPKLLDKYMWQIAQTQDVLGGSTFDMLTGNEIDMDMVHRHFDTITKQLFHGDGALKKIHRMVEELHKKLNDEAHGPKSLVRVLKNKRASLDRKRACYRVSQRLAPGIQWFPVACGALGTAARGFYARVVRRSLEKVFQPGVVDPLTRVAGSAVAGLVGCVACGWYGCMVGCLPCLPLCAEALPPSPSAPHAARPSDSSTIDELGQQIQDIERIQLVCSRLEPVLQGAARSLDQLDCYLQDFKNHKDQVELLIENRIDPKRWPSAKVCEFLESHDLGECVHAFETNSISGRAFVEDLDEEVIRGALGIAKELTVTRLLSMQAHLRNGSFATEPSRKMQSLVKSLMEVFDNMKAEIENIKSVLPKID